MIKKFQAIKLDNRDFRLLLNFLAQFKVTKIHISTIFRFTSMKRMPKAWKYYYNQKKKKKVQKSLTGKITATMILQTGPSSVMLTLRRVNPTIEFDPVWKSSIFVLYVYENE